MPTQLIGKDAPLEHSIERFETLAKRLGLNIVQTNWLNPLPDLFSVHIYEATCPNIFSNGKGSSKLAALASAYGELFERLATHMSFCDYYLGLDNAKAQYVHFKDEKWTVVDGVEDLSVLDNEILNTSLRKFYFQQSGVKITDLIDLQTSSYSKGVCSIPFTNARNGEIVYFPVNLLDNLYGSNGMSAGNSEYEALVQGLSEIIERYVKKEIIKRGLCLPQIPDQVLMRYEKSYQTYKAFESEALKLKIYDASLGGKFPVVLIILFNQTNGTTVSSFGAHPIFSVALDRTLTELMQGRTFGDLDNFQEPTFDLQSCADETNIESHFVDSTGLLPMQMFKKTPDFKFVSWDFTGNTHEQYRALRYMIDKLGFDVYVRQYPQLGVPVYRIIVPGMSEIYPNDDLIYNNTNLAIDYQEAILSLPNSKESQETYQSYLNELENSGFGDDEGVCKLLGILPDDDSDWKNLRIGELKCLIALAAKNYDLALEYAKWTVMFNKNSFCLERERFYQCVIKILECILTPNLNLKDYTQALSDIYGEKTFSQAVAHINGTEQFFNLQGSDLNLRGFIKHQALIKIYNIIKEEGI